MTSLLSAFLKLTLNSIKRFEDKGEDVCVLLADGRVLKVLPLPSSLPSL